MTLDNTIINKMDEDELRNYVCKLQNYITYLRSSLIQEKCMNENLIHFITLIEDARGRDGVLRAKKTEIDKIEAELVREKGFDVITLEEDEA